MGKFTDVQIRAWIKNNEHFEGRADGNGLYLRFPEGYKTPTWRFRYRIAGKQRSMDMGSYSKLSLKQARDLVEELNAKLTLGVDPALEKQQNQRFAIQAIEDQKNTVSAVFERYFELPSIQNQKHKHLIQKRYIKDIDPVIGKLQPKHVEPQHVDTILQNVLKRNSPTTANKVLGDGKKLFNYALKRKLVKYNIFAAFDISDAGGKEKPRDRWLDTAELKQLYKSFQMAKGMPLENIMAIKLFLILGVRKMELIAARKEEFDLEQAVWRLPAERAKTEKPINIPLSTQAIVLLKNLFRLSGRSDYLFPARKSQIRMLPHISPDTINVSMHRFILPLLDMKHFTVHDLRRTTRTHIESLGFPPHVGESVLNHKVKGMQGVYNQYSYFEERKQALQAWADFLTTIECGSDHVVPLRAAE